MNKNLAPIVLFVYNRPEHTKQTLESIKNAKGAIDHKLIIFSDGPKSKEDKSKIDEVRKLIRSEKWTDDVEIRLSAKNLGLTKSIVQGVTEVVNDFDRVIVLEDDTVCQPEFLEYQNYYLEKFKDDERVAQISGYMFGGITIPTEEPFLMNLTTTWGWGTWKRVWNQLKFKKLKWWQKIDLRINKKAFNIGGGYDYYSMKLRKDKGLIDSWGIDFWYYVFNSKSYSLFPPKSLIRNIGLDGSGTNLGVRERSKLRDSTGYELVKNEIKVRNDIKTKVSEAFIDNTIEFV